MERVKPLVIQIFFFLILTSGILLAGCVLADNENENPVNLTEINSTAIAVALNDSRIRTYLTYDGSYEIVYVGPAQYELDNAVFNVTGVEIETPNDLYHVYVNVTNKTVDHIWSQPQRKPVFQS